MSLDTDVLIIGGGMSGLGLAVQLIRQYGCHNFEIVETQSEVGGTWLKNKYPGVGCDVPSHFYSFSFALNPDWSKKFSMGPEIQRYFRDVAEQYDIPKHVWFGSSVETARWDEDRQLWEVVFYNQKTKQKITRKAKVVVSAVGNLSVPRTCEIPGADSFKGLLFHSAEWDSRLDWQDKDIVVLGNGCSATQFVPVMAEKSKKLTQFARQAHYLAERPNPTYSPGFKAVLRYVPGVMRLYRFVQYAVMERDFAGFDIETGADIRKALKEQNEAYVKRVAPQKYWDAVIPKHQIGCKRKVMDTDYLATLHRSNVELCADDPVEEITETGVRTASGRHVPADAIILATGFQVHRMLFPMEIYGDNGVSLRQYWDEQHQGAAQAYLGTCIPGFKNFFTLMGPNTVTGHLSVIYTVECQINFVLRLLEPVIKSLRPNRLLPSALTESTTVVQVRPEAAKSHSTWLQNKLSSLVWSSGCTSWALDPKTGLNIAMHPEYQFLFWWRSVFIPGNDFEYVDRSGKGKSLTIGGWKRLQNFVSVAVVFGALGWVGVRRMGGWRESKGIAGSIMREVVESSRQLTAAR